MKNKKKILILIIPILIIVLTTICISSYSTNRIYPQKLIEAIDNDDMDEFIKLLEKGGKIDNRPNIWGVDRINYPPLHYACKEGKLEYVIKLVDVGADVNNKKSTNNMTPLMCALAYNDNEQKFEIVKYLIEHGADVNIKDYSQTALTWVLYSGGKRDQSQKEQELEIVKYLIEHGATLDNVSVIGHFVFEVARCNNELLLEYLIEKKDININLQDEATGNTSLIFSARHGAYDAVKYLVSKGANITIKNNENKTAYDVALENNRTDIIELLK